MNGITTYGRHVVRFGFGEHTAGKFGEAVGQPRHNLSITMFTYEYIKDISKVIYERHMAL